MEHSATEEEEPFTLLLREIEKLNRRLDTMDDKLSGICVVNERIKSEATFKRTYTQTPLYGAKHLSPTDYGGDSTEEDDDESDHMVADPMMKNLKKSHNCCCVIC